MVVRLIDRLLHRTPPPEDERVRKDAEVSQLAMDSQATLRRVDRVIRVARIDAEIDSLRAEPRR